MLASCNGAVFPNLRLTLDAPFRGEDHIALTRNNAAATLANFRAKPASALAGRRDLTLEDCRRIALANNLELMAARIEELTKKAVEFSNMTKMLPHFLFSGDLNERDNQPYSFSDVMGQEGGNPNPGTGGAGVTSYSTSHERSNWRYSIEARWTPTDAALAYYLTKSSGNDRLRAHHQRVRAAQKLIGQLDAAYYRLLGMNQCVEDAKALVGARGQVSEKMRRAFEKKLVQITDYDRVKQQAIKAERLLARVLNEREKQRNILASAMGVSPDYCPDGGFCLVGSMCVPTYSAPPCDMEMQAVQHRPEAYEAGLNHLNSVNDYKRTIVKYLPRVTAYWRMTADKDRYLYNKNWREVGVTVYFDLLDWLTNWKESAAACSNAEKTHKEMGAVALGIASQVRTAAVAYFDAMDEVRSTQAALRSSRDVLKIASDRFSKDDLDRLALEEARANALQGSIEMTRAVAEANAALAELQSAMGVNYGESRVCE
jgi:outer membrane protein TolC